MKCGTDCKYWKPASGLLDENDNVITGWTDKCLVGFCHFETVYGGFYREEPCIIGDECYLPEEYKSE